MSAPIDPTRERNQHEDDVLERIAKIITPDATPAGETYGGDDAAVLLPFVGQAIVSTDVAILGVHLDGALFPLEDLGYKAVMAALSDLAAMGARPRGLVVAVSAPPRHRPVMLILGDPVMSEITSSAVFGPSMR